MDPADRYTVPLFGDGAAATLIRAGGQGRIGRFSFGSDGSGADSLIVRGGGSRHPDLPRTGESALYMHGRAVYNFMIKRVPASLEDCLARNGLGWGDIDYFVFHQASRFMINALVKRLDLDPASVVAATAGGDEPATTAGGDEPTTTAGGDEPTTTTGGEEPSGDPIVFAASLPLTGGFSVPGSLHEEGYQVCVDIINERGGLLGRPSAVSKGADMNGPLR